MKVLNIFIALLLVSFITYGQAPSIEWQKCLGGSLQDESYCIQQTNDGGFIAVGFSLSNNNDVSGNHDTTGNYWDCWVIKLDSAGLLQWQKCLGNSFYDEAFSVIQNSNGEYVIAESTLSNDGDVTNFHGNKDVWIIKLDSSGNLIWQKCLGGSLNDEVRSIIQSSHQLLAFQI